MSIAIFIGNGKWCFDDIKTFDLRTPSVSAARFLFTSYRFELFLTRANLTRKKMPQVPFQNKLKALSTNKKIVLAGSIVTILGSLLPWYSDVDQFKSGDTFLGITGPMYLVGFLVLVGGLAAFGLILMELLEKPVPKLPVKEAHFHIFSSGLSILMLVLAASVYFHPKFGVNLTNKAWGIGMTMSFIGTGLVMLAGFLAIRSEDVSFDTEGKIEPLIDMEAQGRTHAGGFNRPTVEDMSAADLRKNMTVGDAMDMYGSNKKTPSGWGQVEESINNLKKYE